MAEILVCFGGILDGIIQYKIDLVLLSRCYDKIFSNFKI